MNTEEMVLDIQKNIRQMLTNQSADKSQYEKWLRGVEERLGNFEEWRKNYAARATSLPGCEEGKDAKKFRISIAILGAASKWEDTRLTSKDEIRTARGELIGTVAECTAFTRDVLDQAKKRVQAAGQDSKGGFAVPVQYMPRLIEALRPMAAVIKMGATEIPGLVGAPVQFPKETGVPTVNDAAENGAVTFSDGSFGQVTMAPRLLLGGTKFSRRVVALTNPAIEGIIERRLASELALKLDLNVLRGTGSNNQCLGIVNWPGVGLVAIGANGGAITYDLLIDMEGKLEDSNALRPEKVGFIFHGRTRRNLAKLKDSQNRPLFLWDPSVAQPSKTLIGYQWAVENQIPTNLSKGASGAVLSEIYFGYWPDAWIGYWGDLILEATTEGASTFENHQLAVKVAQDYDFGVVRPESFSTIVDVT